MPAIATALGVSIDELFGRETKRRLVKQDGDSRLRRRLLAIEKLDVAEKRQGLQLLDAFIERGQLKRKAQARRGDVILLRLGHQQGESQSGQA